MKRRDFITLLGGAAAAWPLAARAQQGERMRRIGVLMHTTADDRKRRPASRRSCKGWRSWAGPTAATCGSNTAGAGATPSAFANTLPNWSRSRRTSSWPTGSVTVAPLLQATRTVPIVFAAVADPVGAGFVDSLARPGGNATGFTELEYGIGGKWLELLKQIAPGVTRAAVIRDPAISAGIGLFGAIQSAAPALGVEVSPVNVRDAGEIERAITAFARASNGGLILTASALAFVHRDLIITLAARHKLPAVYFGVLRHRWRPDLLRA